MTRPRDLWYLESRWSRAVTPERSEGVTRGRRDSKYRRSHWPRRVKLFRIYTSLL